MAIIILNHDKHSFPSHVLEGTLSFLLHLNSEQKKPETPIMTECTKVQGEDVILPTSRKTNVARVDRYSHLLKMT